MSLGITSREAVPHPGRRQKSPNIKKSGLETIRELPDTTKKFGKRALAATVTLGLASGFVMSGQEEAEHDNCTDATHQQVVAEDGFRADIRSALEIGGLVEGEQTAVGIAKLVSSSRGYSVSETQLRSANAESGLFQQDKLSSGVYCVEVPGPIYAGFSRADGNTSLSELAAANLTSVENLHKLNPALAGLTAEETIKADTLVRVDLDVDTDYFYREMTGQEDDINTIADGKAKLRNQILTKNGAILGSGGSVNAGSNAWLPSRQTEWMEDHDISVRDIVEAFPIASYKKQFESQERPHSGSRGEGRSELDGFKPGFSDRLIEAARSEVKRWPDGQTDQSGGVENSNPYIQKYTGGPLGAKESWCADFVRYTLNQAGADLEVSERLDGESYLMRRVIDVYDWMVDGNNGSFYVYDRQSILDNEKTDYRPGDIIFFNYDGDRAKFNASNGNHIGIISDVADNGRLEVIDGNYFKRDNVSQRRISRTAPEIMAISRPIERDATVENINIPPYKEVTREVSVQATDRLEARGANWAHRAQAMRFFMDKGLKDFQASGIVANFVTETGSVSLPADVEQIGGGPGRGLAQWEKGARFEDLKEFADSRGEPWTDFQTQLEFVMHEFNTTEQAAYDWLTKTDTVAEATDAILNGYERPAERDLKPRLAHAEDILIAYRNLL